MKLKKHCICINLFLCLGWIITFFNIAISSLTQKYILIFTSLLVVVIVIILSQYFINNIILDIKYNRCEWKKYHDFLENGYYWLGRKVFLFNGVKKNLELLECCLMENDLDTVPYYFDTLSNKLSLRKTEFRLLQYFKCVYWWKMRDKDNFAKTKNEVYQFLTDTKKLELDIYEKLLNCDYMNVLKLLKDYSVTCYSEFLWKQEMIDYLQLETPSVIVEESMENEEFFSTPKRKVKFPMAKIVVIVLFLIGSILIAIQQK